MAKGEKRVEALVMELALPVAEALGVELVDIELVKEGPNRYLRVFIDKEGGVSFEDCEVVSRKVDALLDESLPNPPYDFFEVSSPGLERPLKRDDDFARYAGQDVAVTTYAPVDGQKLFVGKLIGLVEDRIVLAVSDAKGNDREMALERKQIASARLHVKLF